MPLIRGVSLNLVVLVSFTLFIFFHHRTANILPKIDNPRELAAYLRNKFPVANEFTQGIQESTRLLCPEQKSLICPKTKQLQLECPLSAVQNPFKSLEQKTMNDLREQGIIVLLRTGTQEVSQLAIHLGTMLRYFQEKDILFFSDSEGSIGPFLIHDALKAVDQKIRETHVDFKIYRDIQRYQTTGQDITDLQEDKKKGEGRWGWRLDKYKFIHMVEEAYLMKPSAKWYVFIETDSYVIWPNLITWLKKFDSTQSLYLGAGLIHEETYFAHGGSGYILSNPAVKMLLGPGQLKGLAANWDVKMEGCGDVALAKALYEAGVNLTGSHPFINGQKPSTFTYGPTHHWCQPAITMHHLTPHEISSIWRFERYREMLHNSDPITFSELYYRFVEPHIMSSRDNWNNLSDGPTYTESYEMRSVRKDEQEGSSAGIQEDTVKYKSDGKKTEKIEAIKKTMDKIEKTLGEAQRMNADREQVKKEKGRGHKRSQLSDTEKEAHKSFESCGHLCEDQPECFQWVYYDRTCRLSTSIRLGSFQAPTNGKNKGADGKPEPAAWKSGWLVDRIKDWVDKNGCEGPDWNN